MKFSLQTKLLTLTSGILTASVVAALFLSLDFSGKVENADKKDLEMRSTALGEALAAQFYERYGDVQAFAANEIMQVGDNDSISKALDVYIPMYGIYDLIIVTDMKGNFIASNTIDTSGKTLPGAAQLKGKNFSNEAWFKAVIGKQTTDDKEKGFSGTFVEAPYFDPYVEQVYGSPRYVNGFSTLIKNKVGTPIGVISNRANFKWAEFEAGSFYSHLKKEDLPTARIAISGPGSTLFLEHWPLNTKSEEVTHSKDILSVENKLYEVYGFLKDIKDTHGAFEWDDPQTGIKKISGLAPVESPKFPTGLNWKILITVDHDELLADSQKNLNFMLWSFAGIFAVGILVSFLFSKSLARQLTAIAGSLSNGSAETAQAARSIADSSNGLSSSSAEQSASLQQTVTAVDQITAMVAKTAESTAQSQQSAKESQEAIHEGQKAVKDMIHSMQEIKKSNNNIVEQVQKNAREMEEIVKVISEIGGKTKVINDIVFQTKLLSFNASVEAARAGEHGKGFAVVAEEVGNLAQMSGGASKEISSMLDSSIQKVNNIANSTKENVEKLFREITSTLNQADKNAENCDRAFDKVMREAEKVFAFLSEISTASSEQNTGIQEINKMMNQLDKVTQETNSASQKTASAAEELSAQSDGLKTLANELQNLVNPKLSNVTISNVSEQPKKELTTTAKVFHMPPKINKPKAVAVPNDLKTAIGSSSELPSSDDSRFEDL